MITAQQLGAAPIGTAQAPSLALQAGAVPAITPQQLDINSIFNIMILLVVVVMMMKVMTKSTAEI
jgi:hypothetical protein